MSRSEQRDVTTIVEKTESIGMKAAEAQPEAGSQQPLVSVIIPAYNRSWALRKTVQSVFDQTYRPIECLVVDDGSTDNTAEVISELARRVPEGMELRYFKKDNGGANSARNRGLIESRGELICFLDSDDWLLPDSIKTRADVLITDPAVDFCYGLCSVQDEDGHELRKMNSPWPAPGQAVIAPYLFQTDSPLIRRAICAKAGLWREDDACAAQEYEYFARIKFFSSRVVFIDRALTVYSKHSRGQIYSSQSRPYLFSRFKLTLIVKGLVLYGPYDSKAERHSLALEFKEIGNFFSRLKDPSNACAALTESLILEWKLKTFVLWILAKARSILNHGRNRPSRCG